MIELSNVSMQFPVPRRYIDYMMWPLKTRKYYPVLKQVNMSINEGDRVGFLGVNGAGKTTLLKLIGGLLYPSEGAIYVNGFHTCMQNLKARRDVGFVLNEERSFFWRLTGIQNLEFFGVLDNLQNDALHYRIKELIKLVGLTESGDRLVAGYSSGMKQRLAIARGLLADPRILILDEPTRALDPKAVEEIKTLISGKIHDQTKRTLLIATHRFDEVEELCNKVCIVKNGSVIDYRSIVELRSEYRTIQEYYHHIIKKEEQDEF
ncbi:ABC transporter ATP-binding protein [Pedobacter jejuensis]|uniref:ABC transporter ATP-binding protein n=1 Tax=Pedobacter jejuensis TaxID=1268550 RepID=A0A3N0BWF5_9SPHI|nr:ABC transporter ATP-binding protein [Pedobacter jejuensis]RNL53958.1 ABC transporter ATP-binding protein [Pedobacter jejuensis]